MITAQQGVGGVHLSLWYQAISAHSRALRAAGRRPATVVLYEHYLRNVAVKLHRRSPWAVTTADLEGLLGEVDWGPSARKSLRTALVSFYRWAHRAGHIAADPTAGLPTVRVPRGRPRPAPERVVVDALRTAGERERLMVKLAVFAGLRAGEIARVHTRDLCGDVLVVQGKGGKQRDVPLDDTELLDAIAGAGGWLFPNGRGRHLTPNHVSKLVARALPEGWTAHTLRHRFGTRAYAGTRDLLAVSQLLGHASPDTTLVYVQMPDDHMRDAVRAASAVGSATARRLTRVRPREIA